MLGDFNRRLAPDEPFWREIDDGDPPNADLFGTSESKVSKCWDGAYPQFVDHIVLDRQLAGWIDKGSFTEQIYDTQDFPYRTLLSDHCPISVTLIAPVSPEK